MLVIGKIMDEIKHFDDCDEYQRYSRHMKLLIFISTVCLYLSIMVGLGIWIVLISSLIRFIVDMVHVNRLYISEVIITTIAHFGFTLCVSYTSLWIGGKFVELIEEIKMKERIRFNVRQCIDDKLKKIKKEVKTEEMINDMKRKQNKYNFKFDIIMASLFYAIYMGFGIFMIVDKNTGWDYLTQVILVLFIMLYTTIMYVIGIASVNNRLHKKNKKFKINKPKHLKKAKGKYFKK